MTLHESAEYSAMPRSGLLKSLERRGEQLVTEEKLAVIFDDDMVQGLSSVMSLYQTASTAPLDLAVPDPAYKAAAIKVAQFTFLAKESLEKRVIAPFFALHEKTSLPPSNDLAVRLLEFYFEERIATVRLLSWLLSTAASHSNVKVAAVCRTTLLALLGRGIVERVSTQLVNLASIDMPSSIMKENNGELAYLWIQQNILEQREMALLLFALLNSDFLSVSVDLRAKTAVELAKENFGLNQFQNYNLDSCVLDLARGAFWLRQAAAIRALDLKGVLRASVSQQAIVSQLSPIRTADLLRLRAVCKTDLNDSLCTPFKFAWSVLVGYLDLLEALEDDELRAEYPRMALACMDGGIFRAVLDFANGGVLEKESSLLRTAFRSTLKDLLVVFFAVFELDQAASHIPAITECMIRVFTDEPTLCEEFWYGDSQYAGRTSILKHWLSQFPHDFLPLIRLLRALACGAGSAKIVMELLLKGVERIYVERVSDRGQVVETYDLATEVYNLTVSNRTEVHASGIGFILEADTRGVMPAGFNERPMVHWSATVAPFHFMLRVLQVSRDSTIQYCIMDLLETLLAAYPGAARALHRHLEAVAPIFTVSKTQNLPETLVSLLPSVAEPTGLNVLVMAKSLSCLAALEDVMDATFFSHFMLHYGPVIDAVARALRLSVHNIEIDTTTFSILNSAMRFSEIILNLARSMRDERASDAAILTNALRSTVFSYIINHVSKWRFVSLTERVQFVSEVCRLVLSLQRDETTGVSAVRNFAFLAAVVSTIGELAANPASISTRIDANIYFWCLNEAIAAADDCVAIAEFFSQAHIQTLTGLQSPLDIVVSCLSREGLILPVLLLLQCVFQNDQFALNVKISKDCLEALSLSLSRWFAADRGNAAKIRSAALAVLNNTACTRPDVFLFLFNRLDGVFVSLFRDGIGRLAFDHETMLLTGICSVLWGAVADYTNVISALKKPSDGTSSFVERLIGLLKAEWTESDSAVAFKTMASVLEVLAVEICYFNATDALPASFAPILKTLDLERFVERAMLFRSAFPDAFETFAEAYVLFVHACLSLQQELDFSNKALRSLTETVCLASDVFAENCCRVLNFGFMRCDKTSCQSLLGHEKFQSLLKTILTRLTAVLGDQSRSFADHVHLIATGSLLLRASDELTPSSEQLGLLFAVEEGGLCDLRRLLQEPLRNQRAVSHLSTLLIRSLIVLSRSPETIHFVRREGLLKTLFHLVCHYRDVGSMALFTEMALQVECIMEELVTGEILESFVETGRLESDSAHDGETDALFLEFVALLSVIKMRFYSNCAVSERIATIMYGCGVIERLEQVIHKAPHLTAAEAAIVTQIVRLLQLLAGSLETPLAALATEALLAGLVVPLLRLVAQLIPEYSNSDVTALTVVACPALLVELLSTLGTLNLCARPKFGVRRALQSALFPQFETTKLASQHASALYFFLMVSVRLKAKAAELHVPRVALESAMQLLRMNCPSQFIIEMQDSLKEAEQLIAGTAI